MDGISDLSEDDYETIIRNDFLSFIEGAFYELYPHEQLRIAQFLEVLAGKFEACRTGKCKRLIVNIPPRHLKSFVGSVVFPAWLLGHKPSQQIICVSYGQDLAEDLARRCRNLMNSAFYKKIFHTRPSDRQAVHDFATTEGGVRMATSVRGVLTGRGGDFIIIDDPLKPDEALSDTQRNTVNDWYNDTLLSRLNNKETGCIILIMQRLHQNDLVGHVLEQEDWEVVSFPAIAEEDETHVIESVFGRRLYHRRKGEALDPVRESKATLDVLCRSKGPYNFAAQYQQNPMPKEGNIVKTSWLQFYTPTGQPERFVQTILSVDSAYKVKEINDYSVCLVMGFRQGKYHLIHVSRKRLEYPDLKREIKKIVSEFQIDKILIEDRASGQSLLQDLKADGMIGITPYEPLPNTDKEMRLRAQTPLFEEGLVLLPSEAPWLEEYVKELTGFPGARFNDQVDATTQALDFLKNRSPHKTWEKLGLG